MFGQPAGIYAVLVVNDSFSRTQPKESKIVLKNYRLSSLEGLMLDCSKYDSTVIHARNAGKNPDAIFVISKAGNYTVEPEPRG